MRFTALSQEELLTVNLLQDGTYFFEVMDAQDKVSKAGSEMIELQLRIYDREQKAHEVRDYLLEALSYKLNHFCTATGLELKYLEGSLTASDCLGKKGSAEIIIQVDKTGTYRPKNSVKDYLVSAPLGDAKKEEFFNDEIPF